MRSLLAVAAAALAVVQSSAEPRIAAEIARVRSQIATHVPDAQQAALVQRVDRADAAVKAGRTLEALYLLEAAYDGAAAFSFVASADVHSQDDFAKVWTRTGVPTSRGAGKGRVPAAAEAIAQAAEDRGPATYQASRPYAQDAGLEAGLYYLGESQAVMDFAAFARSLDWADPGRRITFRSIAPELSAFDREMTTQYETMQRADHPAYIRASAALKQARSLNDHGAFEGALFQYLLSRYLFAPLRNPSAAVPPRDRIDAARGSLRGADHSIAELFLQFADEAIGSDNADLRRGAAAVVDDVMPAYLAATATPRSTVTTNASAAVTITLVRWPFT